jgi:signal transduction histidine kinase
VGIGLRGLAAVVFIARQVGLSSLTAAIGAVAVVLGGAALVASPFIVRLVRDRDRERAERLAVRQRAEIAAHLHDSVLQTLSLIQREHTDPDTVLRLARAEERGLRSWLYGQLPDPGQPAGLADQLQDAAATVEQAEAALIEVVTVGDLTTQTPATDAVVAAAREAMLNAARHSGDPQPIQVFARITPEDISVFVRDRGVGFDREALPTDRGGVRDSIVGRIAHAGGTTTIRSNPGTGTEVQIRMPL